MTQANPSALITCCTSLCFCAVAFQAAWLDRYELTPASFEDLICSLEVQLHPGPQLDLQSLGKGCRNGTFLSSHTLLQGSGLQFSTGKCEFGWSKEPEWWKLWLGSCSSSWVRACYEQEGGSLALTLSTGSCIQITISNPLFQPFLPTTGDVCLTPLAHPLSTAGIHHQEKAGRDVEQNLHAFMASCCRDKSLHSAISAAQRSSGMPLVQDWHNRLFPRDKLSFSVMWPAFCWRNLLRILQIWLLVNVMQLGNGHGTIL